MLWAWVGLSWLWLKNNGKKNIAQLKKENHDYEQTGVDILWNIWLLLLILLFVIAAIYGISFIADLIRALYNLDQD